MYFCVYWLRGIVLGIGDLLMSDVDMLNVLEEFKELVGGRDNY